MHDRQTPSTSASPVRPLTRRKKKDGELYVRPDAIEQEIAAAIDRPLARLTSSISSVSNGCLVYFARHYRQAELVVELRKRAGRIARRHTGNIPAHRRDDVVAWVQDEFLVRLLAGGDDLDFFEAQFVGAICALTVNAIRHSITQEQVETTVGAFSPHEDETVATDALDRHLFKSNGLQMPEAEVKAELGRVRALLTDKEYRAMYAHHGMGLEIESIDPKKETVATLMNVSGRQVRSYLKSAVDKVARSVEAGQ